MSFPFGASTLVEAAVRDANGAKRVRSSPDRATEVASTTGTAVIPPTPASTIQQISHGATATVVLRRNADGAAGGMVNAVVSGFAIRADKACRLAILCIASGPGLSSRISIKVLGDERASSVIRCTERRSTAEDKLMGGEARSLVSLEHVVCPSVGSGECQIRSNGSGGIVYINVGAIISARA